MPSGQLPAAHGLHIRSVVGVQGQITLDLGHIGVFSELMRTAGLNDTDQDRFLDMLQRKALPEIAEFVRPKTASMRTRAIPNA